MWPHSNGLRAALLAAVFLPTRSTLAQNGWQVNVDAYGRDIIGDAANEPTIAVDPRNPNTIVVGWRQFDTISSDRRRAAWGTPSMAANGGLPVCCPFLPVSLPTPARPTRYFGVDADGVFYFVERTLRPLSLQAVRVSFLQRRGLMDRTGHGVNPPIHGVQAPGS